MKDLSILDKAVQKTVLWIHDAERELGWHDDRRTYLALRAVLHALRDRLTTEEAVQLGAQLPTLVRGFYYEGWIPRKKPLRDETKYGFLSHVHKSFGKRWKEDIDSVHVSRAIFRLLNNKVSEGEIDDVRSSLPKEIRELWPTNERKEKVA